MLHCLLNRGLSIACRSSLRNKHVCFVVKNRSTIAIAVNDYGMDDWSVHAEESALYAGLIDQRFKGADVFVFRYKEDARGDWSIENSKPCKDCAEIIRRAGINRVYYTVKTTDRGRGVVVVKVKDLHSTHVTIGRMRKKQK